MNRPSRTRKQPNRINKIINGQPEPQRKRSKKTSQTKSNVHSFAKYFADNPVNNNELNRQLRIAIFTDPAAIAARRMQHNANATRHRAQYVYQQILQTLSNQERQRKCVQSKNLKKISLKGKTLLR